MIVVCVVPEIGSVFSTWSPYWVVLKVSPGHCPIVFVSERMATGVLFVSCKFIPANLTRQAAACQIVFPFRLPPRPSPFLDSCKPSLAFRTFKIYEQRHSSNEWSLCPITRTLQTSKELLEWPFKRCFSEKLRKRSYPDRIVLLSRWHLYVDGVCCRWPAHFFRLPIASAWRSLKKSDLHQN